MIDYEKARRHLRRSDPVMAGLIRRVGACRLGDHAAFDPFASLTRSIASQQLSIKAADTIFGRFCDLFPGRLPVPAALLALDDAPLRAAGFSRPKISFLRDLAARVDDGRLDLVALRTLPDEEALARLVEVKGIGRWTAEVFLMFRLERPDLFPVDDVGLVRAVRLAYGLRGQPKPARLLRLAEPWRPYRTVASWYLWQSLPYLDAQPRSAARQPAARPRG
ncbi:MAG: DNA-3-methyladenine glycosylase [Vicinamibacterales bacterium]